MTEPARAAGDDLAASTGGRDVYDLLGRRVETRDLAFSPARVSKSAYDRRGNLRRAGDFKDQFAYTLYNALNWTTDTIARDGARASFTQDPNGNVLSSTEVGVSPHPSRTTTHQYDERNNRVKTTHADPALHDEVVYNLDDLAIASGSFHGGALVTGSATTFNARHLAEATMQIPAGGSLSTPVGSTLPHHLTTSYFYDLNANLRAVRDQLSHVTETTVDAADRPTGSRDARGNLVSSNAYSNLDAVQTASVPNPQSGGTDMAVTRTNNYNPRGELKTAVDALNQSVTYARDADGLVTNVKDQEQTPSDYVRNPRGWVVEEKVHVNKGGLTVVSTKFEHDQNGNVVKITDPNGHDYLLDYDSRDRLVKLTSPSGCHEDWVFNEFGEVESYTDGCGKVTTFTRNDLGLVENEKHTGSGGTLADIAVGYQDGFIPTSWTDSVSGVNVSQSLDALRRVAQVDTLINGAPFKHVGYEYNPVGWLRKVTDPEGVAIDHQRDANGQLRKVSRGAVFAQMSYDVGNRLQYKDYQNGVSEHRTYTARGQVETIQTGLPNAVPLVNVAYNYTPAGNPKKIHRNDLKVDVDYEHLPGLYWLAKETVNPKPGSPISPLTLSYGYDGAGNRTTLNRNGVVTTNAYDADNKLTSQFTPSSAVGEQQIPGAPTADSGAPIAAINDSDYANEWTTTGAGQHYAGVDFGSNQNVEKLVCTLPNTKYKRVKAQWFDGTWHDTANTSVAGAKPAGGAPGWYMTQSTVVTFKFNSVYATAVRLLMDAGGGAPGSTTTLRVNELDPFQTLYSPPTTIQYTSDCCGNQLTRKTYTGASLTSDEAFGYDYAHRLASYVRAGSTGEIESSFVYGFTPLGDRLFKTNTQTNVAEFYAHSMGNVIADYAKPIGGSPTLTASYFAADGLDTQIARLVDGTAEYYHGDRLGTVCAKTNALSTTTAKYFDDAWGNRLFTLETLADLYGYTQRKKDDESGLYDYRARSYDPRLGRFIQGDPLGARLNLFAYANNSPLRLVDPTGRQDKGTSNAPVDPVTEGYNEYYERKQAEQWEESIAAYMESTKQTVDSADLADLAEWKSSRIRQGRARDLAELRRKAGVLAQMLAQAVDQQLNQALASHASMTPAVVGTAVAISQVDSPALPFMDVVAVLFLAGVWATSNSGELANRPNPFAPSPADLRRELDQTLELIRRVQAAPFPMDQPEGVSPAENPEGVGPQEAGPPFDRGGGKNAPKKPRNTPDLKRKLQDARKQLDDAKQKPGKVPEDKEAIDKLRRLVKWYLDKLRKSEEHSRRQKGP